MKKPIRFLLCITAALLTLFGGILLLSVAAAGAVTLDQSQGDLLITGSQAVQQTPQGELKRSGSSFIITGQANGHTVRIRKATVPISIQADLEPAATRLFPPLPSASARAFTFPRPASPMRPPARSLSHSIPSGSPV